MREFAQGEIVLATGPRKNRKFSDQTNPSISLLWFGAIETAAVNGWIRFVITGAVQSGKTLHGFVIVIMYHLFEVQEDVICGVPTAEMARDKWNKDLLPAIKASHYASLMPETGAGSRGGDFESIEFKHGPSLKFMTGGGGDEKRSGATTRVAVITETDKMDQAGKGSRETDPISQIAARTEAFSDQARVFMECTVSTEAGRTWKEYCAGTASRIAIRCPSCRQYVSPERKHLVGWQDAPDVMAARERTRVACPSCGVLWDEAERHAANRDAVLLHRGQEIDADGKITGDAPRSNTLAFRWNCLNNLTVHMGLVGQQEWEAARNPEDASKDKALKQFKWAIPQAPDAVDVVGLQANIITARTLPLARGVIPADATRITFGIDVGMRLCHWVGIAWRPNATPHVFDYDRLEVALEIQAFEVALLIALRQFRDEVASRGWYRQGEENGEPLTPSLVLVDSGWSQTTVLTFCAESPGYCATKGFGDGQRSGRPEHEPGSKPAGFGDGYELRTLPGGEEQLSVNADKWKAWTHARLATPVGKPGAMTLFDPGRTLHGGNPHLPFAKHLLAETQVERGFVTKFVRTSRNNHWLDGTALASVAGHAVGERLINEQPPPEPEPQSRPPSDNPWKLTI